MLYPGNWAETSAGPGYWEFLTRGIGLKGVAWTRGLQFCCTNLYARITLLSVQIVEWYVYKDLSNIHHVRKKRRGFSIKHLQLESLLPCLCLSWFWPAETVSDPQSLSQKLRWGQSSLSHSCPYYHHCAIGCFSVDSCAKSYGCTLRLQPPSECSRPILDQTPIILVKAKLCRSFNTALQGPLWWHWLRAVLGACGNRAIEKNALTR